MAISSATAKTYGISEISGPDRNTLRGLLNAFSSWRRRRRERAELYALSDFALKDFGINRAEIEGIVSSPDRDASGRVR